MTQPNDDTGNGGARTFTQAEVDKIVGERVARERAKFSDYDELKSRAAEADKQKSQLDRIETQLAEQVKRTEKAEEANLRREVADELGLTAKQARRLQGKTKDELLADGREYMEDNGIKPKSASTSNVATDDDKGKDVKPDVTPEPEPAARNGRRRPTETLRSGAPVTPEAPEETDPMKLVANVRRF